MPNGKPSLDFVVLLVNGKYATYKDVLWLDICLERTILNTTDNYKWKIFLWNHDVVVEENEKRVCRLAKKWAPHVVLLTEHNVDITKVTSEKRGWKNEPKSMANWGGFHAHRTALHILYQQAISRYNIRNCFTLDTDSWPVKFGWDEFFMNQLERVKLVGVWRNELCEGIKPYIHPSGLGIKVKTVKEEGLRFDSWPANPAEDSLSHFSRNIFKRYGRQSLCMLRRSNKKNFHPVFGGVYGDWIYHHHAGTRLTAHRVPMFKGSIERGETEERNQAVADVITERVFFDYDNYIAELRGIE